MAWHVGICLANFIAASQPKYFIALLSGLDVPSVKKKGGDTLEELKILPIRLLELSGLQNSKGNRVGTKPSLEVRINDIQI